MIRTGIGFDAHAFVQKRNLVIGGVTIPNDKGLAGHSDADVLTHAVIDALLGACALGDIGSHFPDTNQEYKNINSRILLEKVVQLLTENNFQIVNIDSTIILQSPRVQQYIPEMRQNLATTLNIETAQVSVKATTTDFLGFTGRNEGVAALAVATVVVD